MLVQIVAYAFCILCAIGATAGFVAVAVQGAKSAVEMVQRTNTAAYTPNGPLPNHSQR
jgi:hypothetical protein